MNQSLSPNSRIKQLLKQRYGSCAQSATAGGCCTINTDLSAGFAQQHGLYSQEELGGIPAIALKLSRGCGNPTGFANLKAGEVVVDFGCGAGIDVILAVQKVSPNGSVIGVDFSSEMIARAKQAASEAEVTDQVELIIADLDETGLGDNTADVVISNCVINLCPDKESIYREMFRILKPKGRIAISDVIYTEEINTETQERFEKEWSGCVGGAMEKGRYFDIVRDCGFTDVEIQFEHLLSSNELTEMACCPGSAYTPEPSKEDLAVAENKIESVKFTARKPGGDS